MTATDELTFTGPDGKTAVRFDLTTEPPSIWIDEDLSWDNAAKQFWNAVYRCQGRIAPFPDV